MKLMLGSKMEKKKYGKFENYEIEHLADKMIEIEECKNDKEKMKYVLECLEEKKKGAKKSITSIEDLLKAGESYRMKDDEDDKKEDEDGESD
jgi:hypothetical protein